MRGHSELFSIKAVASSPESVEEEFSLITLMRLHAPEDAFSARPIYSPFVRKRARS
jgi:hypothetical protein